MRSQICHVEHGAYPPQRRDVDDIGVPAYPGKEPKQAGATSIELRSSARSITLGPHPNHNLVSHLPRTSVKATGLGWMGGEQNSWEWR